MLCVTTTPDGTLAVLNPQPVEATACTLVVLSPSEAASPFNLSLEAGTAIGVAILGVFAVAATFREIADFFRHEEESHHES